ncbi:MAG: hypothetical protein LIP00_08565 [Parabacteroides sp.]|nr:hypothetical protein [Parabacteroides sp.]
MKIRNKLFVAALCITALSSCQKGLVYDEVPEDVYNNVSLKSGLCEVVARRAFPAKVWQGKYNQWAENIILDSGINSDFRDGTDYTNPTDRDLTILGTVLKPGETMRVRNTMTEVADAGAPEGKLYVLNIFAFDSATYKTPNKKHLFVESAFAGETPQPRFIDPVDGRSESIKLPTDPTRLVVAFLLDNSLACTVEALDNAPALGVPGDFSKARRYMVINTTRRGDGGEARRRLYEINVTLLP